MKPAIIRSLIFNLLFYALTLCMCVLLLPSLVLPRKFFMGIVHLFVNVVAFLERFVLGLKYEVRGREHLPAEGSYIVAAKHQSAYETMKLHKLFKDPAVILKKSLLSIPLWGLYLKKSDPIAIDRSTPEAATASIKEGAQRMNLLGRPIVIFPQGTRVGTDQSAKDKPYKVGVARIQEATDLPIIPMAMNAGMFWPRNSFFKSSGTVIFEFLPALQPGMERAELMKTLEQETEGASQSLMNEARESTLDQRSASLLTPILATALIVFGLYSALWFFVADRVRAEYPHMIAELSGQPPANITAPNVFGYPGKIKLHAAQETLDIDGTTLNISDIRAQSWPLPGVLINVSTGPVQVKNFRWQSPLTFDSLTADITHSNDVLSIYESALKQDDFTAALRGTIDFSQEPFPKFNLGVVLDEHQSLLRTLVESEIIKDRAALFIGAGFSGLANKKGQVELTIQQRGQTLYAGPLPIMTLPEQKPLKRAAKIPSASSSSSGPDWDSLRAPSP